MSRHDEEDRAFYNLVYDAWRSGRDPNAVSRDLFDDRLYEGHYPDAITLNMVMPPKPGPEPEPMDGPKD